MANDIGSGMATQFVQIPGLKFEASLNVEQWMLLVQQERVGELDKVVKDQAEEIHKRNQAIALLNAALSQMTSIQGKFSSTASSTDTIGDKLNADGSWTAEKTCNQALSDAGLLGTMFSSTAESYTGTAGNRSVNNGMNTSRTKGDIDTAVTKLKSTIDALSNLQQMDTLRLQSVMNKRNESFDIMSNFIKKYSDVLDSIIRNLA